MSTDDRPSNQKPLCYIAEEYASAHPNREVYPCPDVDAEIQRLQDALRAAEAQKERCAGMTAGEWRGLFIKTQDQWEASKSETALVRIAVEALKAEKDALRAALEQIATDARYLIYDTGDCTFEALYAIRNVARAALEAAPPASNPKLSPLGRELYDACNAFKADSKEWKRVAVAIHAADAEIERLRAALTEMVACADAGEFDHWNGSRALLALGKARVALEAAPPAETFGEHRS